ncbi:MAG TPA: enoyl-CoA hydratase/isomerase family protein [Candidatus Limnocylindrales bacterium]|nr:enoyl-CoA hydratase/isomerase family protein [Candidatus Limnocylindrales bacterium]
MPDNLFATDNLRLTLDAEIAELTLTRPARLNALSPALVDDLHACVDVLARERRARVVILTGEGRGFCAGLDLQEYGNWTITEGLDSVEGGLAVQERIASLMPRIRELPQPWIAAVNGAAAGGGLALALACDVRYAAPAARFSVAFVKLGLSGCDVGVSFLLPRVVGAGHAFEMSLTGRLIDAEEALRIGLANRLVGEQELLPECQRLAEEIRANTRYAVAMTKQVLDRNIDATSLRAAIELENRTQVLGTHAASTRERMMNWKQTR